MSDRLTKQDLGRNELGEIVAHSIEYAEQHARQLALTFVGALLAGLAGLGVWLWWGQRVHQVNEQLAFALKVYTAEVVAQGANPGDVGKPTFASETARQEKAKELFQAIAQKSLAPKAAQVADLYLGEIALNQGDKAAARRHWEGFAAANRDSAIGANAQLNLMRLDREEGKGQDLASRLRRMLEKPEERVLPEDVVLYQLGLTLQQLGKGEEARSTFRRLMEEFPRSPLRAEAQRLAGGPTPNLG